MISLFGNRADGKWEKKGPFKGHDIIITGGNIKNSGS
jgi:hypothetical protein